MKEIVCSECGDIFLGKNQRSDSRCPTCWHENHLRTQQKWQENSNSVGYEGVSRKIHSAICVDCHKSFKTSSTRGNIRCPKCSRANKKALNAIRYIEIEKPSGYAGDMGYKICISCGHLFDDGRNRECVTCRDKHR